MMAESNWTFEDVLATLQGDADPRGIEHWKRQPRTLTSYGIGLTRLRKLAKQIGRDHWLAQKLWDSDCYEMKVLGLLVDDPQQITPERAEMQVNGGLENGMLAHVFVTCDATLAKTPFAFSLARTWMDSPDPMRRRCGYGLLYELSKKNPKGMDDDFLCERIDQIAKTIHGEEMWVRESMNTALMGIGKRNLRLNQAAIAAAKQIGPVDIDYGDDNACQPLDVLKHLTAAPLQKKLAAAAKAKPKPSPITPRRR